LHSAVTGNPDLATIFGFIQGNLLRATVIMLLSPKFFLSAVVHVHHENIAKKTSEALTRIDAGFIFLKSFSHTIIILEINFVSYAYYMFEVIECTEIKKFWVSRVGV
jgi:hypothetical protein